MDRPDILSVYTVRMEADKKLYPLLLSNGNKVAEGDLPEGKHFAVWEGFNFSSNLEKKHLYVSASVYV